MKNVLGPEIKGHRTLYKWYCCVFVKTTETESVSSLLENRCKTSDIFHDWGFSKFVWYQGRKFPHFICIPLDISDVS